jgi:hypothetical protein
LKVPRIATAVQLDRVRNESFCLEGPTSASHFCQERGRSWNRGCFVESCKWAGERAEGVTVRLRALRLIFLALCLGLAGCDKCGNPIEFNALKVPGSCYGPNQMR